MSRLAQTNEYRPFSFPVCVQVQEHKARAPRRHISRLWPSTSRELGAILAEFINVLSQEGESLVQSAARAPRKLRWSRGLAVQLPSQIFRGPVLRKSGSSSRRNAKGGFLRPHCPRGSAQTQLQPDTAITLTLTQQAPWDPMKGSGPPGP